jgi:hypothetical protein
MPSQADKPATVRSMALRLVTSGGQEWRTGMNNIPVFPVNSAQGLQLLAFNARDCRGGSQGYLGARQIFLGGLLAEKLWYGFL